MESGPTLDDLSSAGLCGAPQQKHIVAFMLRLLFFSLLKCTYHEHYRPYVFLSGTPCLIGLVTSKYFFASPSRSDRDHLLVDSADDWHSSTNAILDYK